MVFNVKIPLFFSPGGISFVSLNSAITFSQCLLQGNIASSGGGVHLAMDNRLINMQDSTILDNRVDLYGGGIYFGQEHESIRLTSLTIHNNHADSGAGIYIGQFNYDIVLRQLDVFLNEADEEGGGLFSSAYEMEIYNSIFTRNQAHSSAGMVLTFGDNHALSDKKLILVRCTVTNNYALTYGGVNLEYGSNLDVQDCLFQNNTALIHDSGGLAIHDSFNCSISRSTFDGNRAGTLGGALYIKDSSDVLVKDVILSDNKANFGGGMYFENVLLSQLEFLQFVNNTADLRGGGLWLERSDVNINKTMFTANVVLSGNGAAIHSSYSGVSISSCRFVNNQARWGAGTVYWVYHRGQSEPAGLRGRTNHFADNVALYGRDWV